MVFLFPRVLAVIIEPPVDFNDTMVYVCDYENLTNPEVTVWLLQTERGDWMSILLKRNETVMTAPQIRATSESWYSMLELPVNYLGRDTEIHLCCTVRHLDLTFGNCTSSSTSRCHNFGDLVELTVHPLVRQPVPITWLHNAQPILTYYPSRRVTWHLVEYYSQVLPDNYTLYVYSFSALTMGTYTAVFQSANHSLFQVFLPRACSVKLETQPKRSTTPPPLDYYLPSVAVQRLPPRSRLTILIAFFSIAALSIAAGVLFWPFRKQTAAAEWKEPLTQLEAAWKTTV